MKKIFFAAAVFLCIGVMGFTQAGGGEAPRLTELPLVGDRENFLKLMRELEKDYLFNGEIMFEAGSEPVESAAAEASSAPSENDSRASDTNVQVEGVDEGDLLKNDGEYLYYARYDGIQIIKAETDGSLTKTATIPQYAEEIYLYDQKLVLIGPKPYVEESVVIAPEADDYYDMSASHPQYYPETAYAAIYDISDKAAPKLERDFTFSGSYLSSRQINGYLYLLTNRYIYDIHSADEALLPSYSDSENSGENIVGYEQIRYFPDFSGNNFLLTAAIPLAGGEADVKSYLGAGENIYVSVDHMYVASPNRLTVNETGDEMKEETELYKFSLGESIDFQAKGTVAGSPLNQFSMDEHEGNFRIATTEYDYANWRQSNNMFILDEGLNITGELRNIAPTERIYSVRFMGNRAYMVTFRQIDPLFALDLSDPAKPQILGALKIPGYSDYLHPYDENHLIGFGKDTTTDKYGNAYYKGMKISFFDVTDVENPKEKFVEYIGDRGTESELLRDHKALMFSKEDGMFAFPVSVVEQENKTPEGIPSYGEFVYQGALFYHIDAEEGFTEEGYVSHMNSEDYSDWKYFGRTSEKYIRRIAYIGDYFYTISDYMLQSHDRRTFEKKGEILLTDSIDM